MKYEFEEVEGELSPCLIGSTRTVNNHPRVVNISFRSEDGAVYSCDMARWEINLEYVDIEEALKALDTHVTEGELITYTQGRKIGGYYFLYTYRFDLGEGDEHDYTSVVVGLGLVKGNKAVDKKKGFIEFNPNKLYWPGFKLYNMLKGLGVTYRLLRYDLAIDYPVERRWLRMVKDGRKYSCEISNSVTEYLGQRNHPGRVKLYDKAVQAGYPFPLTRLEITCDAEWDVGKIVSQIPVVYTAEKAVSRHKLHGVTFAFATLLQAYTCKGDVAETWLDMVNPKTRTKIRKAFADNVAVNVSKLEISMVRDMVTNW